MADRFTAPVLRVLREAGWFEVRPANNYKAIHQDMVEAVELLYFVTEIHNEPRKRGSGPSAQLIPALRRGA